MWKSAVGTTLWWSTRAWIARLTVVRRSASDELRLATLRHSTTARWPRRWCATPRHDPATRRKVVRPGRRRRLLARDDSVVLCFRDSHPCIPGTHRYGE